MYNVSNAYKAAMKSPVQRVRMTGTVNGQSFGDNNILRGSFSITNQCSGGTNIEIGQVYIGQLDVTLLGLTFPQNELANKTIEPIFGRLLADNTYEDVPLGVFNIGEANRTASGLVITAYDNMKLLDKSCGVTSANGTPYELATMACSACKAQLANTPSEFGTFANGSRELSMYAENDIETWRDFIAWLAMACGCFVYADRSGKIRFKSYNSTIVDVIDDTHRLKGGSFSDFTTRYTGVSCVNIKDQTTTYYGLDVDDGLVYNMGSNPFLQYGVAETVETIRRAVLDAISVINYVPFSVSMIGDPAYDLGDVIQFSGGIAPAVCLSCITQYTYTLNGTYKAKGVGQNPAIASAKSKTDKNIAGLMASMKDNGMHYSVYTNSRDIEIGDGQRAPVISQIFAVNEQGHVVVDMQLCIETNSTEIETNEAYYEDDTVVTAEYYYDGDLVEMEEPVETYQDAKHILRLRHDLESSSAAIHRWLVYLSCRGGSVKIDKYNVLSVAMGQTMVGNGEWSGTLEADDYIESFNIDSFMSSFTETVNTEFIPVVEAKHNDNIQSYSMNSFLGVFSEAVDTVLE